MAKAHVYKRDHVNTDEIIPARYLNTDDTAELAKQFFFDFVIEGKVIVELKAIKRLSETENSRVLNEVFYKQEKLTG